ALGVCTAQWYPRMGRLSIAIGDCGIGIRESLSQNPEHREVASMSHARAAALAFTPLVSRKHEGGMGLAEVAQSVAEEGGGLILATGDGYITSNSRQRKLGTQSIDLPGVQVEISFPARR
ncbi:MAG: hypothetical protein AB7G08_33370, partial [Hyphomicrobiaceae bacterium]